MTLELQKKVTLAPFSTFKIGGVAEYFVRVKNQNEIIEAINWARKKKLPFFILGNGSNVLFSDKGFNGLIIKLQNNKFKIKNKEIIAQAGCQLQTLVKESIKKNLAGLEWAIGIPGTLGGAIYQNAGAFGREMKDIVKMVKILEIQASKFRIRELKNKDCKFGYRESIFKKRKNWIILEAILNLKKTKKEELKKKIKEFLKIRKERQPLEYPSAGSVFKNIPLKKIPKKLKEKFKEKIKNNYLPVGALIESLGLKGKKIGGAKISEKHANFIVNVGKAKAEDVKKLIDLIKKEIKKEFKLEVKEEIELVGF